MEEKDKRFKWDLGKFYKNLEEFDKDFEEKKAKYINAFDKFEGKLNNKATVLEYLNLSTKRAIDFEKLEVFVFCARDVAKNDNELAKREELLTVFGDEMSLKLTALATELSKQPEEFFDECIKDPAFSDYKIRLMDMKDARKHILSKEEENAFAIVASSLSGYSEVYNELMNKDRKFKPVMVNGKEEKLTSSNLITFLTNPDREVRKQASLNSIEAVDSVANGAITSFIYKLKADSADLAIRKFDSMLSVALEDEHIPKEVYYSLIRVVNNNIDFTEKYHAVRKRALGLDNYYSYDSYLPISKGVDRKYTIDEQIELLRKSLKPLGDEYIKNLDIAINDNWFDLCASDEKRSDTYAIHDYATKQQLVFMQQNYDVESLSSLAHEFGHAVNFRYVRDAQPKPKASSYTYTAEIASITNEILTMRYLLNETNNIDEKIYYLDKLIDNFIGTVITQTRFSEFEDFAYNLVENGEPITVDILCDKWDELVKKYNGKSFDKFEEASKFKKGTGFITIHHFLHYTYYVFNYATSYTCANVIASKLLNGDREMQAKYLEFLTKGTSSFADDQVKEMGIDLSDGKPFELLFEEMNEMLKELDALIELREMRSKVADKVKKTPENKTFAQAKKEHQENTLNK